MYFFLKQKAQLFIFLVLLTFFFTLFISCGGSSDGDSPAPAPVQPTALDRAVELKGEGESAGACAETIMQEFTLDELVCIDILNTAEYTSVEIGEAIRDHFGYDDANQAAKLLDDANFDLNAINIVMRTIYNLDAQQVETVMEDTLKYNEEDFLGITAREYIERFSPILKFDASANTFPMDAQKWFEEMLCGDSGGPPKNADSSYDYTACQNQNIGWGNGSLSNLTVGSSVISTLAESGYQVPTYYKVRRCGSSGQLRIQYWWFYGFQQNAVLDLGQQDHPADWEHIMLTLSIDRQEVAAVTYYQHAGWYTKIVGGGAPNFPVENGRPVVYVGKTAHGAYHNSGGDGTALYYGDWRNPSQTSVWNTSVTPLLNLDIDSQEWMGYDRVATWRWGFDAVGTHPTVALSDSDFCSVKACRSRDVGLKTIGCWNGYSDCQTGDTWCGTFVCAESSIACMWPNSCYTKDYVIPTSDNGIIAQ